VTATSKIEQELLEICRMQAYKPGDDRQAYLRELTDAVDKLTEESWEALSPAAREWQYDAGDVIDLLHKDPASLRTIPDFAVETAESAIAAAEAAQPEEPTDMPRAAIASKTNGKAPAKTLKQVRAKIERRPRRTHPPVPPQPRTGPTRAERAAQQQATRRARAKPTLVAPKKPKTGESVPEVIMRTVIKNPDIEPKALYALVDQKTKTTREDPVLNAGSVNAIAYNTRRVLGHIKDLRKTNKNLDIDRR
jgi:hypothetical protein